MNILVKYLNELIFSDSACVQFDTIVNEIRSRMLKQYS